ncbi:MAG: cupredoxin domain-containing protein [Actinomycetota bacterium]|nr:cupredoxin domain-containing protein [Actinomycetota bacterium]
MLRRSAFVVSCSALLCAGLLAGIYPAKAGTETVETQDNKFSPVTLTIAPGDSVTFKNTGNSPHTATAKDGSFDTANLNPGESRTLTIKGSGSIAYVCKYHETLGMRGTIEVSGGAAPAPAAPSPTPSPSAAAAAAGSAAPPATPPPASQKYFPKVAFGMLILLLMLIGIGYIRTTMRNTEITRS